MSTITLRGGPRDGLTMECPNSSVGRIVRIDCGRSRYEGSGATFDYVGEVPLDDPDAKRVAALAAKVASRKKP